jgi:transcriptional regulator with XRE-family HTH domain
VERLKELRCFRTLSQEQLSQESGRSGATISRIERREAGTYERTLEDSRMQRGWPWRSS